MACPKGKVMKCARRLPKKGKGKGRSKSTKPCKYGKVTRGKNKGKCRTQKKTKRSAPKSYASKSYASGYMGPRIF